MMLGYKTKNSSISSKRLKQNDYYYKYILNPGVRGLTADVPKANKRYQNFIPYNENEKPSVEDRRNEYLGKLDNDDYVKSDPDL